MSDLISRQAVIDVLKQTGIIQDNDLGHLVVEEINRIPTAYDTDKVEEELMTLHIEGYCPNEDSERCVLNKTCHDCYMERLGEIIRKGGIDG